MPPPDPLEKISVRVFASDIAYVRRHYPDNYNAFVRRALARAVNADRNHTKRYEVPNE